jgi:hypothetical protein
MNEKTDHNNLIISHVVGYMLKVLKNKKKINKIFKTTFANIRHGNYHGFIELIKEPIPDMVIYSSGIITVNPKTIENECDFIGLHAAGPSLEKYYKLCFNEFGEINDTDFNDEIYRKLAVFEIKIRMHANNHGIIDKGDTIINIINKLQQIFPLNNNEIKVLIEGNKFLNKVKHPEKNNNDNWKVNIVSFEEAYKILEKYKINVF